MHSGSKWINQRVEHNHDNFMTTGLKRELSGKRVLSCDIEVRVLNVADALGTVRVALCTAAQWLSEDRVAGSIVPARPGVVTVMLLAVPAGTYGLLAHHDANGDGQINRDFLGRPTEGIGFSRNAPMLFGPPRFADAAFTLTPGRAVVDITLRFERSRSPVRTRPPG